MTQGEQQSILVVDDNEPGRYAVGRVLRQAGFDVAEAGTGTEALQKVASSAPDLVLLDTRLPDIPGVEVCRRIKSSPAASTPVLQMSASAVDDNARVAALESGADGYITSPIEPAVLVATVRSLLRIRTAEQALQESALEWQVTFDAITDGVALLDTQGIVRRANVALPALLGREMPEITGRSLDELFPAPDEPSLAGTLESRRRVNAERTLGDRAISIAIDPIADAGQKLRGGVARIRDITERKLLDQQLWHSQKMESIGLLAGGVAHDFNNLLTGILGNASLALESLTDPDTTARLLDDVVRAGERAAELTRQLLAYAGKGRFVAEPIELSSLIRELVPLIQSSIPRKVELTLDMKRDLPLIKADRVQIEQLIMNLLINAGEAIRDEAGSVVVTTESRTVDSEDLSSFLTGQPEAGNYVLLRIGDTGCGMDEETQKKIFDPFFSTKFLGRGLGLSAALGIIRGHKGALRVTSAPSQGTIFEVLFPASASAVLEAQPREHPAIAQGRGLILAVDDEPIIRNVLHQALTRAGYEVLLAQNGAEALTVFSRYASRISLVVLDLVMPVMSGEEALPHLLTMKPGVKVIVSSGQDEEECVRRLREPRVAAFIQKPYRAGALAAKVREVLGADVVAPASVRQTWSG